MADINLYNKQALGIPAQQVSQQDTSTTPTGTAYSPNMQGVPPAMQGLDYDTVKLQAEQYAKDNALKQATDDFDIFEHPFIMAKNAALALAMAIVGTSLTNKVMVAKDLADDVSNIDGFKQTPIYKAGERLDKSFVGRFLGRAQSAVSAVGSTLGKFVPNFIKEIPEQMKIGGIAVLDKSGMFSRGKGCEALIEAVTDLGRVDKADLVRVFGDKADDVIKILDKVKAGKVQPNVAFADLEKILSKVPANQLATLKLPQAKGLMGFITAPFRAIGNLINKVPFMEQNINMAVNKGRIFSGAHSQGPVTKMLQKAFAFVGEATGNGVLGGKFALFMGGLALITGFNAASKAEKGDKIPAFMEDYIGFTLGSYIMSFVVGTWFNKFLGVAELGMDKETIKALGSELGLDMTNPKECRLQSVVIACNEQFKSLMDINKLTDQIHAKKIGLDAAKAKAAKLGVENVAECKTVEELLNKIAIKTGGKDSAFFRSMWKRIEHLYKSSLSFKSVLKKGTSSEGFLTRLGRYVVQKPLNIIGKVLSVGRYDLVKSSLFTPKGLAKWAKRFGGGLGRALLVLVVLIEPFRNAFIKLSHAIFGKPKHSQLDEGKEEAENSQAPSPQTIVQPNTIPTPAPTQQAPQPNTNILDNMLNKTQSASPAMSGSILNEMAQNQQRMQQTAPIAAAKTKPETHTVDENAIEQPRTYIPSSDPAPIALQKSQEEIEVEMALAKAEAVERQTQQFLARGF